MPLFRRKASYREQHTVLPVSLSGPEPTAPAKVAPVPASPAEVVEASQHNAGHSSGWHPEDAPYLTSGALQRSPVAPVQRPQTTLRLPAAEREMQVIHDDDPPTDMLMTRSPRRRHEVPPPPPAPPRIPAVTPYVYTLGYSQPGARLVLDTLVWHEGWLLVDIRHAPVSTWPDWTQRALLQRYGPAYVHLPALGNLHYRDHRLPIVLADAPTGIRSVLQTVYDGRRCLLLCACKDYRTCHCAIVARLLQQAGAPVTHLVNQRLPVEQVRIARIDEGVALSLSLTDDQLQTAATQSLLTLTRTQTITLPVVGRLQSLSVQVSLTAWPNTRLAPLHALNYFPKGDSSR
jgi:Protein of unknown function, DUF488